MAWQRLLALGVLATVIGCSANQPVDTDPFPEGSVRKQESGVVTDGDGVVRTTGERSTAATLKIPPGHLPKPGECRIWEPGHPPGQQRHLPNGSCDRVEASVEAGQWVVFRPGKNKKIVEVRMYGSAGSGSTVPSLIRIFDIATGVLLEELAP